MDSDPETVDLYDLLKIGDMTSLRKLYIMRHAERVDFTFGAWIPSSFDKEGNYIRTNLNMPLSVPKRKDGPMGFFKDCPLTRIGLYQATITGEAMKSSDIEFSYVFCSPSLRCVETCTNALKASDQSHLPINIEPGLFEWLSWYRDSMPKWMSLEELRNSGFNVSMDYESVLTSLDLTNTHESSEEYYNRNYLVAAKILEKYPGNILFGAHAASLDTCSRQLTGKPPRKEQDLLAAVSKATYASVACVDQRGDGKWYLIDPSLPPLLHTNNNSFDWRTLVN